MWTEVARAFQHGDGYIYFMMALGFIGTIVLIERFIMLQFIFNLNFKKFLLNLKKIVKAEDFDRAITLCRSASKTSLPRISLRVLEMAESDPDLVKGTLEEEVVGFLPKIETRIQLLPALAVLILFTGILGTIDSLWNAFHALDALDSTQKQISIGHGVSSALTYTSLGLVICMFFLFGHQCLSGMAIKLTDNIHHGATVLRNLLVTEAPVMQYAAAAPAAASAPHMEVAATDEHIKIEHTTESVDDQGTIDEGMDDEDEFDDAAVDDIKDEEEII